MYLTFFLCETVPLPSRLSGVTFSLVGDIGLAGAGAGAAAAFVAGLKLTPFPPMLELPE